MSSAAGTADLGEAFRVERGAADEPTVYVRHGEQVPGVGRLDTAAVEDPDSLGSLVATGPDQVPDRPGCLGSLLDDVGIILLLAAVLPAPKRLSAARPSGYLRTRAGEIEAAVAGAVARAIAIRDLGCPSRALLFLQRYAKSTKGIPGADAIADADVIYMEPVVQPDYTQARQEKADEYGFTPENYRITKEVMKKAKGSSIILHSLPRRDELLPEVDDSRHALADDDLAGPETGHHLRISAGDFAEDDGAPSCEAVFDDVDVLAPEALEHAL